MSTLTRSVNLDDVRAAFDAYDQAAARWMDAQMMAIDLQDALYALKDRLRDLEAEVMANGGIGDQHITGSNDAARKAQLQAILASYEPYLVARDSVRRGERELAEAEARRTEAEYEMRGGRLRIEYATSLNHRVARVEAGTVEERNRS